MNPRGFGVLGGITGFSSVAAATLGRHLRLPSDMAEVVETGARYQLIHAVALALVAVALARGPNRAMSVAGWLFTAGQIFFPASLYVFALTGNHAWAWVTPVGGLCYLTAWFALAIGFARPGAP